MINDKDVLAPAHDAFERYYTEKIWDWIPAIYKDEDGLATNPDVLRSIVQILARQSAIARRSIDRLWDDQFIELCDDWAIPYIGDLVGTRLVHELNRRGRRSGRGAHDLLSAAQGYAAGPRDSSSRISPAGKAGSSRAFGGWPAPVTGSIPSRPSWRGLSPRHRPEVGRSSSPPAVLSWLTGRSTSSFTHPTSASCAASLGRYNIPKLNFHLLRLLPFEVNFATAADFGEGRFTFDPSGRDIPLFRPDQRSGPQECHPPREWELPAPIPCRLLGEARYMLTAELIDALVKQGLSQPAADALSRYVGVLFRHEARLRQTIESLTESVDILASLR